MPRYTSSQTFTEGNTQIVALPEEKSVVETKSVAIEDEDLEIKLARITEQVPVRIQNTSGSSAGSGSGDFHQYRQMRRHEQDRLARMEVDYRKRKEIADFEARRDVRVKADEERTAKRRAKRQKKKTAKKQKKGVQGESLGEGEEENGGEEEEEKEEEAVPQEALD